MRPTIPFAAALAAALTVPALAGPVALEDFDAGASSWFDGAGTSEVDWLPSGGPDDDPHVTTTFDFSSSAVNDTPVLFRGEDGLDSSGDAFVGDWISAGVTELSFALRHDHDEALNVFVRFATSFNFPGAAVDDLLVQPGEWTTVSIPITPANPELTFEGPASNFFNVFGALGNIQVGVQVDDALAGSSETIAFDLDRVQTVPAPSALALAPAVLLAGRRRRRRHAARGPSSSSSK